ncbi:hypothetical protein FGE12_09560 [Aggregicoccus sp. 17bor-14]|nr:MULTISPECIES: hypothetical protein [Myxococcaceae]MBF5042646.1 hypothetical protein [Simulacricoccus sp. 17bor-14]MRI88414.1 hypothetical protein [Aggregicoccus sp. 17bor-14]
MPGDGAGCGLLVTVNRRRKVVRLAYDAPHTYGRRGAQWYGAHHALARTLSRVASATVHAYVFDPDEREEVISWGNGRRVGGECVVYDDVELPEEMGDGEGGEAEERAFERLRARWPLGHLAYVYGLTREELLRLPRAEGLLLPLEVPATSTLSEALAGLLVVPPVRGLGPAGSAASSS